jgi:hypothetical protein
MKGLSIFPDKMIDFHSYSKVDGMLEVKFSEEYEWLSDAINRLIEAKLFDLPEIETSGVFSYADHEYQIDKRYHRVLKSIVDRGGVAHIRNVAEDVGVSADTVIRYKKTITTILADLGVPFELTIRNQKIFLEKL